MIKYNITNLSIKSHIFKREKVVSVNDSSMGSISILGLLFHYIIKW